MLGDPQSTWYLWMVEHTTSLRSLWNTILLLVEDMSPCLHNQTMGSMIVCTISTVLFFIIDIAVFIHNWGLLKIGFFVSCFLSSIAITLRRIQEQRVHGDGNHSLCHQFTWETSSPDMHDRNAAVSFVQVLVYATRKKSLFKFCSSFFPRRHLS